MSAIVVLSTPTDDAAVRAYLHERPSHVYAPESSRFAGAQGALSVNEVTCTRESARELIDTLERVSGEAGIAFILLPEYAPMSQVVAQWASSKRLAVFAPGAPLDALRKAKELAAAHNRFAWQEISNPTPTVQKGSHYYGFCRTEVLGFIRHQPRVVIEAGCGGGSTGGELKSRFPGAHVTGIELNEDAAKIASGRLDRAICENIESLDFAAAGFAAHSVDTVLFADVLEHLYDPWHLLDRLKPFLTPDAHIIASIPNVRNFWLIGELLRGNWEYMPEGLLDVTHIRFFTRKSISELFEQTGYQIQRWGANEDGRVPAMVAPAGQMVEVGNENLAIKRVVQSDLDDLRTLQFLVDAVVR